MKGNIVQNTIKATIKKTTLLAKVAGGVLQFMGNVTIQQLVKWHIFIAFADDNSGNGFSWSSAGKWYIGFLATQKDINDVVAGDFVDWIQFNYLAWPKGDKWDQGDQGIQGAKGDKWDTGDTWPQGIQGIQGAKGDTGEKGDKGDQGIQWVQGIQGIQGEKGDTWDKGDAGQAFKIAKTYSSVAGLLGDTSPTGILAGEFALVTTANTTEDPDHGKLYLWTGTIWQYITDIAGLNGLTWPQGAQGIQGIQWPQGIQGEQWPQGIQWPKGDTGNTGAQWPQGIQGVQGIQWPQGETWPQGEQWPEGDAFIYSIMFG